MQVCFFLLYSMSHPFGLTLSLVLGFIKRSWVQPIPNYRTISGSDISIHLFCWFILEMDCQSAVVKKNLQYTSVLQMNSEYFKEMQASVSPTHWSVAEQTLGTGLLQVGSISQAPAMNQILLSQNQSGLWLQAVPGGCQSAQGDGCFESRGLGNSPPCLFFPPRERKIQL